MKTANYKTPSDELFDKRVKDLWTLIGKEQPQLGYKGNVAFHNTEGWIYDTETEYKESLIEHNKNAIGALKPGFNDPEALKDAIIKCFHHTQFTRTGKLISEIAYEKAISIIETNPNSYRIIRDVLLASGDKEKEAFQAATELFSSKRYDAIAYLFMIKDPDKFFSIRSETSYGEKLAFLGFRSSCVGECSWDNYQEYIYYLNYIRSKLQDYFTENITIVDAESFMWMMYKLINGRKSSTGTQDKKIPGPDLNDPFENYITGMEGDRNGYYVTRFERDPKLRKEAAKRGNYTCSACGMRFDERYGDYGKNFIEVHHTVPLKSYTEERQTSVEELVTVCSNCHSIIHRKKNYVLTIDELKQILSM